MAISTQPISSKSSNENAQSEKDNDMQLDDNFFSDLGNLPGLENFPGLENGEDLKESSELINDYLKFSQDFRFDSYPENSSSAIPGFVDITESSLYVPKFVPTVIFSIVSPIANDSAMDTASDKLKTPLLAALPQDFQGSSSNNANTTQAPAVQQMTERQQPQRHSKSVYLKAQSLITQFENSKNKKAKNSNKGVVDKNENKSILGKKRKLNEIETKVNKDQSKKPRIQQKNELIFSKQIVAMQNGGLKISYPSRSAFARKRPRIGGRFISTKLKPPKSPFI